MTTLSMILFVISLLVAATTTTPNPAMYRSLSSSVAEEDDAFAGMNDSAAQSRTLVTMAILRWVMGVFKAMIRPARDMYLTLTPEIAAFKCLSESRDVPNLLGYNREEDAGFEGYFYETPRASNDEDRVLKRTPRFIDEMASLLKDGSAMACMVPYMRERVSRWLDS